MFWNSSACVLTHDKNKSLKNMRIFYWKKEDPAVAPNNLRLAESMISFKKKLIIVIGLIKIFVSVTEIY